MSDKLEAVARAICLAGDYPDDIRKDCEVLCSMCLDESRAAIEAMREPTLAMEAAAIDEMMTWRTTWFGFPVKRIRFAWHSMIDVALEGES